MDIILEKSSSIHSTETEIHKIRVGIIGGSGLDDLANHILHSRIEVLPEDLRNDFGIPSGKIYLGTISDVEVALLSRHGPGHKINPTDVNYRANIVALKKLGCTHILASTACGSLSESIERGQLVIPDSFLDHTRCRPVTLFNGDTSTYRGVCHVPMEPAFHPALIDVLTCAGTELGLNVRKGGTIVTIEGPRFSSKAESKALQLLGGDLVNMTTCPEVIISKEAGILYAAIAMATDYDCWRESDDNVCAADVMAVFKKNINKVTDLIVKAVEIIGQRDWNKHIDDLKNLIASSNVTNFDV